jgi:lysophospholipase L1-like esterase
LILNLIIGFTSLSCNFNSLKESNEIAPFVIPIDTCSFVGAHVKKDGMIGFSYSGFQIKVGIVGDFAELIIHDYSNKNQPNYILVQGNQKDTTIQLTPKISNFNISSILNSDSTIITITKLTEAQVGAVWFEGILVNDNQTGFKVEAQNRKIVWIGNSITCGYGNEVSIAPPPQGNPSTGFHSVNQNITKAYGSLISKQLNAQSINLCYSGKGIYRNYHGDQEKTIPKFINQVFPDSVGYAITNAQIKAPLYIINAGTNDFGNENLPNATKVDSASFVAQFLFLLKEIETIQPRAKVLLVGSNMLNNYFPKNARLRYQKYLQAVTQNYNGSLELKYFQLKEMQPPYGENWHPSAAEHQRMADHLLPIIKAFINWE